MLFTPKPQFRGRKLFFKNYFLPSRTINPKSNSLPLHHLSPHNWRHQNAQESRVIQVNIERKKVDILIQETNPSKKGHPVNERIFQLASKGLSLPKASKGPWAKISMCTSTNPSPFKPKDGFPVFKNILSSCGF